jgi:hypothetical protein
VKIFKIMRKLLFNYSFYSHLEIGKFQGVTGAEAPATRRSTEGAARATKAPARAAEVSGWAAAAVAAATTTPVAPLDGDGVRAE